MHTTQVHLLSLICLLWRKHPQIAPLAPRVERKCDEKIAPLDWQPCTLKCEEWKDDMECCSYGPSTHSNVLLAAFSRRSSGASTAAFPLNCRLAIHAIVLHMFFLQLSTHSNVLLAAFNSFKCSSCSFLEEEQRCFDSSFPPEL
jgi:hypothetical protein